MMRPRTRVTSRHKQAVRVCSGQIPPGVQRAARGLNGLRLHRQRLASQPAPTNRQARRQDGWSVGRGLYI
jgi:hypothetical protein